MTFASESPSQRFPISDAQGGDGCAVLPGRRDNAVAALDPFLYRDPQWCERCEAMEDFFAMLETEFGRVGICRGCGEEKVQLFSRTTSEAA